jgi:hypothetical protein
MPGHEGMRRSPAVANAGASLFVHRPLNKLVQPWMIAPPSGELPCARCWRPSPGDTARRSPGTPSPASYRSTTRKPWPSTACCWSGWTPRSSSRRSAKTGWDRRPRRPRSSTSPIRSSTARSGATSVSRTCTPIPRGARPRARSLGPRPPAPRLPDLLRQGARRDRRRLRRRRPPVADRGQMDPEPAPGRPRHDRALPRGARRRPGAQPPAGGRSPGPAGTRRPAADRPHGGSGWALARASFPRSATGCASRWNRAAGRAGAP